MTEIRVVGCDPGEMVGLAFFTSDGERTTFHSFEAEADVALNFLRGWLQGGGPAHIGIERYTIGRDTHKKSQQPRALQVIGEVQGLARAGGHHVSLCAPGPAKTLGNPIRLRTLGMWNRGSKGHDNDASSHCLIELANSFPREFHRIISLGMVGSRPTETQTEEEQ